jgi:hypothetical protein
MGLYTPERIMGKNQIPGLIHGRVVNVIGPQTPFLSPVNSASQGEGFEPKGGRPSFLLFGPPFSSFFGLPSELSRWYSERKIVGLYTTKTRSLDGFLVQL